MPTTSMPTTSIPTTFNPTTFNPTTFNPTPLFVYGSPLSFDTSSSSNNTNSIITHANSINNGYNSYDGMGISPSPKSFDFNNNKPMTLSDESHTHSNK
eukprot:88989_1